MKTFCTILCLMLYVTTDLSRPAAVLALTNANPQEESKSLLHPEGEKVPPEMLQELLWLFRKEDPSTWNYCILGLSCLVLLLGFFLLGASIKANRNRKVVAPQRPGYEASQPEDTEMKQAFVRLAEENNTDSAERGSLPPTPNMGQVTIQWKDGNVTTLYEDRNEEEA